MSRTRWTTESIRDYYVSQGCQLLEDTYVNNKTPMRFVCSCSRAYTNTFKKFQIGQRCPDCAGNEKLFHEDIARYFAEHGCELLSTYHNFHSKLDYRCLCGRTAQIAWSKFKEGKRCKGCMEDRKRQFFLKKYGVSNPTLHPDVSAKRYQTNLARYGFVNPLNNPVVYQKAQATLRAHYGVDHASQLLQPYSKESQQLFWQIYNRLSDSWKAKTYFAELNEEFASQKHYFRYDFVVSSIKRCIEYHGSAWHPSPILSDNATGWHVKRPDWTAKDSRDRENLKFGQLTDRGFEILVVWDHEWMASEERTIHQCLEFLRS